MPEASDNCDDNDSDDEDQDGDTDDLAIGSNFKNPFFTNDENKSCPNGWIALNGLQPNEDVLERYQRPHSNTNKVRVGVKILIPLAPCSYFVDCEWWID